MPGERREVPVKQGSDSWKSGKVFGQGQETAKTVRAGLDGGRPSQQLGGDEAEIRIGGNHDQDQPARSIAR